MDFRQSIYRESLKEPVHTGNIGGCKIVSHGCLRTLSYRFHADQYKSKRIILCCSRMLAALDHNIVLRPIEIIAALYDSLQSGSNFQGMDSAIQ